MSIASASFLLCSVTLSLVLNLLYYLIFSSGPPAPYAPQGWGNAYPHWQPPNPPDPGREWSTVHWSVVNFECVFVLTSICILNTCVSLVNLKGFLYRWSVYVWFILSQFLEMLKCGC